ncbi:50S ribosomal protein L18 [Helicobacter didelphidarum]|uniref:Large ribosomal subunit protein uL18 n=1 Tax=Helicobacter didelphidarum TaxID=2040648 RepID=A0A3D8INF0_9HELI|nr:50S ribosomal protein L18 [Helicobacter didelphidarum]RDU66779.1 50S ribosomal protein L18 [Helicobacter didelphidarum]
MTSKVLERKKKLRLKRKMRARVQCAGCSIKPRVSVFRSNKYFYAQAIDDTKGHTLVAVDSRKLKVGNTKADVIKVGEEFAKMLKTNNIESVIFDRNGYLYHGVIASFADSLRNNGIAL